MGRKYAMTHDDLDPVEPSGFHSAYRRRAESKHVSRNSRRKIFVHSYYWWYSDPMGKGVIKLNPVFHQCGWNIGRLAGLLGLGERTFARVVQESLGMTGKVWLRQVRIVAACHLLRECDKIEPLAISLGFRYHGDFSREFKKLVGVLPSEFVRAERSRAILGSEQAGGTSMS